MKILKALSIAIIFLKLVLFSESVYAQNINITQLAWLPSGQCQNVVVKDRYAFAIFNSLGFVIDVSDPASPKMVNQIIPVNINKLYLSGNILFLMSNDGIHIVDVTNPLEIEELSFYKTKVNNIFVDGEYVYIAGYNLKILNINNPSEPSLVSSLNTGTVDDIYVADNYVYLLGPGILIIDVSDITSPIQVASYSTYRANNMYVKDDYIYLSKFYTALEIVDISDPINPKIAGSFGPEAYNVTGKDSILFVSEYYYVGFYSISDPRNPEIISGVSIDTENDIFISDSFAYFPTDSGLTIYSINTISEPEKVCSNFPGDIHQLAYSNNLIYAVNGLDKIVAIDVSNKTTPKEISKIKLDADIKDIFNTDKYLFCAASLKGLKIIDYTDPNFPFVTSTFQDSKYWYANFVFIQEDYAYINVNNNASPEFWILDIGNLDSISVRGTMSIGSDVKDLFVSGDYAFIIDNERFQIIDVSDPANPSETSIMNLDNSAWEIAVQGNYAYLVGDKGVGLQIIDISDPSNPITTGKYDDWENGLKQIFIQDSIAYCDGLTVYNVSSPYEPIYHGEYSITVSDIVVDSSYIFVSSPKGFYILENSKLSSLENTQKLPSGFALFSNFPNPFNSGTTIRYSLSSDQPFYNVSIKIYNSLGQIVKTLKESQEAPGTYNVKWDGKNDFHQYVSSGIYIYRIDANNYTDYGKMLLIK